ncbi:hypothetical protein, partial [Eisenbergiella porci]|uniref:hypothetical protein n=1 Tax=Eisenbergiella porci TaxID=2652274 RepID=UPI003A8F870F
KQHQNFISISEFPNGGIRRENPRPALRSTEQGSGRYGTPFSALRGGALQPMTMPRRSPQYIK